MRKRRGFHGPRMLLLAVALTVLGLCAGAVAPGSASADDDDNGDNGGNYHQCTGGTITPDPSPLPPTVQTCTITQPFGVCIQRSSDPVVVQTCLVSQGPTTTPPNGAMPKNNSLTVVQIADQQGAEGTLDATQIVDGPTSQGEQRNFGTANNTANISQVIKQKLASGIDDDDDGDDDDDNGEADEDDDGEPDDDNGEENGPPDLEIIQNEQAHQSVDLCQGGVSCDSPTGMFGRNRATVFQSETQHEFAANAAMITQNQNVVPRQHQCSPGPGPQPDDTLARQCYTVEQQTMNASESTSSPANFSRLRQFVDQLQVARNAAAGHQAQGHDPLEGGLDHSFEQFSPGIARLFSDQDEFQTQQRTNTGAMTHQQLGALRKGSGLQGTHEASLVDIDQAKIQDDGTGEPPGDDDGVDSDSVGIEQFEDGPTQTGVAAAFATTTGDCVADLLVSQQGQSETASEPAGDAQPVLVDNCAEFVACGTGGEFLPPEPDVGPDVVIQQEPETCVSSDDPVVDGPT
jgi:hypothetical protein